MVKMLLRPNSKRERELVVHHFYRSDDKISSDRRIIFYYCIRYYKYGYSIQYMVLCADQNYANFNKNKNMFRTK